MMGSKPKVVTRGSFPHQCTASHASVWVDRRRLDACAVVSLTALDMMYALITLAHALGGKNPSNYVHFHPNHKQAAKAKKNDANSHNPTDTLGKFMWSCICTRPASEIQFIYWKWV